MNKRYYHFVGNTLRDGFPIPADGEWLTVKGKIVICESGLHASAHVADALRYAPGNTLCLVELEDIADKHDDKVVAAHRKIIARFDATELLRADARQSALSVAHLWKMPAIVRQYLETGDETIREEARKAAGAVDAAYADAAAAASADAAYAAAAAAAYAAAAAAYAAAAASADAAYVTASVDAAVAAAAYAAAAVAYAAAAASADAAYVTASADAAVAARKKYKEESRARLKAAVDAKFKELLA